MTLDSYMTLVNASSSQAGGCLMVTSGAVRRWRRGERIPNRDEMTRIYVWSNGAVQPNDFHDLPNLPK